MTDNRICYNCQYIYFDSGSPGYSSYTPGTNMSMYCNKNHWKLDYYADIDDLKRALESAETCPDYTHSQRAKELAIPESTPKPHVQPHCHKCGSELHEYYDGAKSWTHCPVCRPVNSVTYEDGKPIAPHIVR